MSHFALPAEIIGIITQWVSEFGGTQNLQSLALVSSHFVSQAQGILLQRITFNASHARPGGFLTLLKGRPNLAHLVKSVTLTQSSLQQKSVIRLLLSLHNVERLVFPDNEGRVDNNNPRLQSESQDKYWSWLQLDPSIAASLATIGQRLPHLKELVLRDVEDLPLDTILKYLSHLDHLELRWVKCGHLVDITHHLKSIRWHIDDYWFRMNPAPTWLLGSTLTHVHLVTNTTRALVTRYQPSCTFLTSLRSLIFEVNHWHSTTDWAPNSLPFFLSALKTVPDVAPLESLTVIFREWNYTSPELRAVRDSKRIAEGTTKLGDVLAERPIPVKKLNVKMYGFKDCEGPIKDALERLTNLLDVKVECDTIIRYL
ncbi:hypothetical protein DL96DRAFT_1627970 [Flagelloscypha sp. PMI_526]|nr:hypothetical protein DL96DRAFT_1627970 [Flagelloscypha sp. PMI_526]